MSNPPGSARRWLVFDAFRMDLGGQRLWAGDRAIALRPKSWDVLRTLVERPGLLVTRHVLHHEVWRDAAVSDDTLTQSILELRRVLGDDAHRPRFIETVHRRGFRFIAKVNDQSSGTSDQLSVVSDQRLPSLPTDHWSLVTSSPPLVVGRQDELRRIEECRRRACGGARQVVFVTGETGIGKTTLVEEFLRSPALHGGDTHILRGQCVQQYGPREPYMSVFEALERLLRSSPGAVLLSLLRHVAPSWYAQMPSLWPAGEPSGQAGVAPGVPVARMLRELGSFLESLATQSNVVLVLEDLHWSHLATADLVSFLAQRRDPARLLVIGTYRPAEASVQEHPIREVKQLLQLHGRCTDLALGYLSAADVGEYLQARFGDGMDSLAPLVHRRTDGNPLFVVAMIEELIRRGWLLEAKGRWMTSMPADSLDHAVPCDVKEMITLQFQHCDAAARAVLEAASVVGVCFGASTVAAAIGRDVEDVEAVCRHLVQQRFLLNVEGRSDWFEGSVVRPYEFAHALHRQVIYEQIPDTRRQHLHQAVSEALEAAFGARAADIAAELSIHCERSGHHARAVHYLSLCAARAQQRGAPREAVACARHALSLLDREPESPERCKRELELHLLLNVSLNVTCGYRSREVRENSERARALCEQLGDTRQLFEIVHAIWYAQGCGPVAEGAWRSVEELAHIAESLRDVGLRRRAHLTRGRTQFWSGNFRVAVEALGQFLEEMRQDPVEVRGSAYGVDPVVAAFTHRAVGLWFLGCADQGRAHVRDALARAEQTGEPFDLASGLFFSALIELLCGNTAEAGTRATRAAAVCADKDIAFLAPVSRFLCGAVLAQQGDLDRGLAEMRQSLAEQRAVTGSFFCDLMLAFIAAACGRAGQWDDGLRCADEGIQLTETMLERVYAAELWRIKGELVLGKAQKPKPRKRTPGRDVGTAAAQCFRRALEIAREQEARSLALRSATSLARLSMQSEENRDAPEVLGSLYASFTEGFDTPDLTAAQALLEELGHDTPARRRAR